MSDPEDSGAAERPSKSQRKKDMLEFRRIAEELTQLTSDQIGGLASEEIISAVEQYRRISKGNARKRQIQHIAKLIRGGEHDNVLALINRFDSSSKIHAMQINSLERWREGLLRGQPDTFQEVVDHNPDIDRQKLRHLVRLAIAEQGEEQPSLHSYRKLFQFLRAANERSR